ncbi:TetR/AcrR family transcriptional regulator [Roseateles depolymerans]|uniref:TetR family transcriptional regulator n=1 Tax=Roseateles depolymerans TaxID=76731 RepID=A0A0U3MK68_9BURK|nr:TetR/AcrR family transcriptional regulator [Roseateles depolymerans]ALV07884.1 TetR family transcriptional regulator [Roseateles depolymerans]REG21895.1 TetR family transcriptional regulator [Roseateles depolymerans]
MARGRAPGFDASREEILAQAARLFATHGFAATSMNQVAEACAVSKPTLYHYVRDKHELLALICQTHLQHLADLVEEVSSRQLSPQEHLRALILSFVRAYGEAQFQHRVLTEDMKFLDEAHRAPLIEVERQVVSRFAEAVATLRPELRDVHLHKPLTMLLFGMINWTFTWLRPDGALTYEAMAPMVADLFFGGLGAVKAEEAAQGQAAVPLS